jgi:hypothetical protein
MHKVFLSTFFAFVVGIGAAQAANIVVKIAPPRGRVEHRDKAPSRDHVWVGGYQRWDGNRYEWQQGRWETPPHPHAKWVAPKWNHRKNGYVFSEGRWR